VAKILVKVPSDVTKADNGQVRDELLVDCGAFDHFRPGRELKMHHLHAASAMRAMIAEASAALELGQIRGLDSYRTLQRQTTAFDGTTVDSRKTPDTGRYIPDHLWGTFGPGQLIDDDVRKWKDKKWKRRKGTVESAVPGQSNHGFGLAIDFVGDQIDALFPWLKKNAARFGFVNDNPNEKWHWSYSLGDDPSPELIKVGAGGGSKDDDDSKALKAIEEDADMRVIDLAPNTPSFTRLVVSGRVKWVRGHAAGALDKMKVTALEIQRDELKDLMRTFGTEGLSPFNAGSRNSAPDGELDSLWEESRL
jgi:hypothetical protein